MGVKALGCAHLFGRLERNHETCWSSYELLMSAGRLASGDPCFPRVRTGRGEGRGRGYAGRTGKKMCSPCVILHVGGADAHALSGEGSCLQIPRKLHTAGMSQLLELGAQAPAQIDAHWSQKACEQCPPSLHSALHLPPNHPPSPDITMKTPSKEMN